MLRSLHLILKAIGKDGICQLERLIGWTETEDGKLETQ